jgi:hypothetical protein
LGAIPVRRGLAFPFPPAEFDLEFGPYGDRV